MMNDLKWSGSEKQLARRVFDEVLQARLATTIRDFKARAAAVTTPAEMWDIGDWLQKQGREINQVFDYRYSQLPLVFARLVCEGHLDEARLSGLSEEKMEIIHRIVSFSRRE